MREPRAAHPGQEQFLQVLDRDEAERRFRAAIDVAPRGIETVSLDAALGRVLAADVIASVDVPSFDRSNVDGFAVIAEDTFGASEEVPRVLSLAEEVIHTAIVPSTLVRRGTAVPIATGGMMPRGADAVVMVEHADVVAQHTNSNVGRALSGWPGGPDQGHPTELHIRRAVTAGSGVSFAGTDITAGETVLRTGTLLTSRDTGVLAAIGVASIDAWRRPIVAILSTGDEIIAPGTPMQPARIYDSNSQVLADAVRELGGEARRPALRRHQQRRRGCLVPHRRRAHRARYRGARRRVEAGEADLPGGDASHTCRRPARLSDLGDFHVPRVRRARDHGDVRPADCRTRDCPGTTRGASEQ